MCRCYANSCRWRGARGPDPFQRWGYVTTDLRFTVMSPGASKEHLRDGIWHQGPINLEVTSMSFPEPGKQNSTVPPSSDLPVPESGPRPAGHCVLRLAEYALVRSFLSVVRMLSYSVSQRVGSLLGSMAFKVRGELRR